MNAGEGDAVEIGRSRRPIEDERLVQGRGRCVSDLRPNRLAFLAFVRSPHAHARIGAIDPSRAAAAPGVLAVLTAADLPARPRPPSTEHLATVPPWLAGDVARNVGEPIVAVVAETEAAAVDATEFVDITYEPRPAVTDPERAMVDGAPLVHPDLGTNVAFRLTRGSGDVDAAFAGADAVVTRRVSIPRLAGVPMEPLGILADWNAADHFLTAWCTTQAPWRVHAVLAETLGLGPDQVRVVAPDVGGGFGVRGPVYGEYVIAGWASRFVGPDDTAQST